MFKSPLCHKMEIFSPDLYLGSSDRLTYFFFQLILTTSQFFFKLFQYIYSSLSYIYSKLLAKFLINLPKFSSIFSEILQNFRKTFQNNFSKIFWNTVVCGLLDSKALKKIIWWQPWASPSREKGSIEKNKEAAARTDIQGYAFVFWIIFF